MKYPTLFAAFLALAFTPVHAQEEGASPPEVAPAEEALAEAADEEVLETPENETLEATLIPEERPANAPLQFTNSEFMDADQDGNGILSIEEASTAFPGVAFEDSNGDGLLNLAEADAAVEGINLGIEGANTYSVVGESKFMQIMRALEDREEAQQVAQQG